MNKADIEREIGRTLGLKGEDLIKFIMAEGGYNE